MKNDKEQKVLAIKTKKDDENDSLSKVIKEFIEKKFTKIDGIDYFIDGNCKDIFISLINLCNSLLH